MEKIKNCCCGVQKVIPLAFDESLSYYEILCMLVAKMNELIDFANNDLTNQIKLYIDNQFNNIIFDTLYNEENETLIIYLKDGVTNG